MAASLSTTPVTALSSAQEAVDWLRAQGASGLAIDSRKVKPGDAFIAWPGHGSDGRQFVAAAFAAGAVAALVEAQGVTEFAFEAGRPVGAVADLKAVTGDVASLWWSAPSRALDVVACTGTNGKTSSAWWVAQALSGLGRRCGLIGTLGVGEPPSLRAPSAQLTPTGLTTPDPVTLQRAFRDMQDQGFCACAIEASSIGLVEHRLAGTAVRVAMLTNFTQDHLDFHADMAAYWDAKRRLFDWPGLQAAVINIDDPRGVVLARDLAADGELALWTYSTRPSERSARLWATSIRYEQGALTFELNEGGKRVSVATGLVGDFNVSNLLGVVGALRALGISLDEAAAAVNQLTAVPGRMQRVVHEGSGPSVVVDYAHTPDALEKALASLRPLATANAGQLHVVFGCGGNRDAGKRPLMGAIAAREADRVVLTNDNPRQESAADILAQIQTGMPSDATVLVVPDRREAIRQAVRAAQPGDVVLVAGKGHETEQDTMGVKQPFSDVTESLSALAMWERRA